MATGAQIAALRTAGDPEGRFRAKRRLVHSLYHAGYNGEQLRELFRLIDWMIHLRSDWEARFARIWPHTRSKRRCHTLHPWSDWPGGG